MFSEQHGSLLWLALVITGDIDLARQSVVDACSLSKERTGVFREWLNYWALAATAREAVHAMRDSIRSFASGYADHVCSHADHEPLSAELVAKLNAGDLIARLDPCARAVLVMCAVLRASVNDCVTALGISRKSVLGAYCVALNWIREGEMRQDTAAAQSAEANQRSPYPEACFAERA